VGRGGRFKYENDYKSEGKGGGEVRAWSGGGISGRRKGKGVSGSVGSTWGVGIRGGGWN